MATEKPVVLVLASMFPRWEKDTEARFVYDLCQQLKEDYEPLVLTPHCAHAKTHETLEGLSIIRYRYAPEVWENLAYEGGIISKLKKNRLNWLVVPFFFFGQWLAILKLLRQHSIKVIHAHWLIPQGMLAIAARTFSKNKPAILCTSHGGDLHGLNDPLSKLIKRKVINSAEKITVVSSAMQQGISKLVPTIQLPVVAPMGTDLQHFFIPNQQVERKPYQLLFVGRLVKAKGLEYLLQALPIILKNYPEVMVNIAGHGADLEAFKLMVKELDIEQQVSFMGALSHSELVPQYQQASIAVFPFIQEGFGLVTVEAMGCECPVVVSDIPAIQDIIIDGETGLLAESKNAEDFARQIMTLLASPEKAQLLAKHGRDYVVERFDLELIGGKYKEIIRLLL